MVFGNWLLVTVRQPACGTGADFGAAVTVVPPISRPCWGPSADLGRDGMAVKSSLLSEATHPGSKISHTAGMVLFQGNKSHLQ